MRAVAKNSSIWFIVDDQEEVETFCASFESKSKGKQNWVWLKPADAEKTLLTRNNKLKIAGVLIDIDLTSDPVIKGTGLALAQGIRAKQKGKLVPDYPLVRFANPLPISRFVGSDPGSNDLFDLLTPKDDARGAPIQVVKKCAAIREVYDKFSAAPKLDQKQFAKLCGVSEAEFAVWADVRFYQRIAASLASAGGAVHVGAGNFIRSFLVPDGLLVDEELLAVRLGVKKSASSSAWKKVLKSLDGAKYTGVGSGGFERWWARGIEAFWLAADSKKFLQELTASERVKILSKHLKLKTLEAIKPGDGRYWRLCAISREANKSIPVDPRMAVKLVSTTAREPWLEPEQVSPDIALMHRNDRRLDKADLKRFIKS